MKFSLQFINKSGGRIGVLSSLYNNPQLSLETPLSLITTKGGSITHLTQDVFHNHFARDLPLSISSQHFVEIFDVLERYQHGVAHFASLNSHPVCVTVQDAAEPLNHGYNDINLVSVFGKSGRLKLSPIRYSNLVEVMKPDWYEALNDADTPIGCSIKRINKSEKNSKAFLLNCLDHRKNSQVLQKIGIIAPLLGGHDLKFRSDWSGQVGEMEVDGFSLLGIHTNGTSAEDLDFNELDELSKASLRNLPNDKLRQASGAFNIFNVIQLVENGVDIFDSSLPQLVTDRGRALNFPVSLEKVNNPEIILDPSPESFCDNENITSQNNVTKGVKKTRLSMETHAVHFVDESKIVKDKNILEENVPVKKYEVDLRDKRYSESQEPLVTGCSCYTCKTFTKAYVHHLLSVREMLAGVLLTIHNLHQWQNFFATIREAIKTNRLKEYKELLRNFLDS